ncbi:VAN3-binding protein-like [Phalaenopsis equestris]|uniref:VAN3-binding protein-like n=1 Tax=Phalaenopsis equestris TaxID=78828 RepID=UPI0009E5B679|nr:VAN3-binding protein-like [Phalaenopsis equestris]
MNKGCDLSDLRPPESPLDPMELLSRLWSSSALQLSRRNLAEDFAGAYETPAAAASPCLTTVSGNPFSCASSSTSQLVLDRLMSDLTPRSSGRLSHSSGPLIGGYLTDSPPLSPSDFNELKHIQTPPSPKKPPQLRPAGGGGTVGKWLKERRGRKKEEARSHNADLHAAISLAGVASAVAAVAVGTAAAAGEFGRDETEGAVASAGLIDTQLMQAAKAAGADREQLSAAVGSAVRVRDSGDIVTLTAAAATALRGAATLKARSLREVWNIAAVIPEEKGGVSSRFGHHLRQQHELNSPATAAKDGNGGVGSNYKENFLGICSQEVLSRGAELLKRTRKGNLHWKIVSVYISKMGQVILKMKSKHIAGTITKNKRSVVIEVCREVPEWSGRNILDGVERRRHFGLRVAQGRVIEFECKTEREHEIWTEGIAHLLEISRERRSRLALLNK